MGSSLVGHSANVFVDAEDIEPQSRFLLKTGDSCPLRYRGQQRGSKSPVGYKTRVRSTLFTALDYDRLADEPLEGEAQPSGGS